MDSLLSRLALQRPISLWLAPALVLALGACLILFDPAGLASALGNREFDLYQSHAARTVTQKGPAVRVLELPSLDEDSLIQATRTLSAAGVRVVVFTAPVEMGPSPQTLAARLPPGSDAARAALSKLPEPSHDLAQAIAETRAVVPVVLGKEGRQPLIKARFVYRGTTNPFAAAPRMNAAAAAPALLEANAAGSAAVNLTPDPDGLVRRLPVVFRSGDSLVPGMAAEAQRVAAGASDITVTSNERDPLSFFSGAGIGTLEVAGGPVPTDSDGGIRLYYAANMSERMLNPNALDAVPLKDAVVLVGAQGQVVKTPLGPASAAQVIAEGVENLLSRQVLARPSWAKPVEALILVIVGLVMIGLLGLGLAWAGAAALAGTLLLGSGSWYFFLSHHFLLDAATPSVVLLATFVTALAAWLFELRMVYAALRMAFADSLPRASVEKLARRPSLLKLEGDTRTVTYLVCGVRGLPGLAAAHRDDPAGFTRLTEKVLTPLIDQALAHGGTIDRLTADGFAAFWNAPLDDGEHALHACEAGSGMTMVSGRVTEELMQQNPGAQAVEIGVGIATGPVIAGGFGASGRMGYSVHGDAVTLAQTMQALSHHYGPALIVSEETKRGAERSFAFLEIDTIAAGRNTPPVTLYAVMGNPVTKASPKFRALTVFHDHIFQAIRKQNWTMARDLIAQCRRLSGVSQQLYDLHLARIAYYEKHPPGPDWDGAFRPILE
jgi:adenylate cyclase